MQGQDALDDSDKILHVPAATINQIVDELLDVHTLSWSVIHSHLKLSFNNVEGFKKENMIQARDIFL